MADEYPVHPVLCLWTRIHSYPITSSVCIFLYILRISLYLRVNAAVHMLMCRWIPHAGYNPRALAFDLVVRGLEGISQIHVTRPGVKY
jgi:hypothetical protein